MIDLTQGGAEDSQKLLRYSYLLQKKDELVQIRFQVPPSSWRRKNWCRLVPLFLWETADKSIEQNKSTTDLILLAKIHAICRVCFDMFGCIVSGRLVQTDAQQVGPTQFVFNLTDVDKIHHVVVFLTGVTPFPEGMGGGVYYCYPTPEGPTSKLLGFIANSKPSAIFKLAKAKSEDRVQNPFAMDDATRFDQTGAQIGISVEPLDQLSQQTPSTHSTPSNLNSFVEYTQKMLENFFNYASSFAITQAQMTPNPSESFVPLSVVQKWYGNYQRKMTNDPNFWKN